jgi:ankyrin repeat protein
MSVAHSWPRHFASCNNSDAGTVNRKLAAAGGVHAADSTGATPLHWACSSGYPWIAAQLLQDGADPNVTQGDGHTPLYLAVKQGHSSVVDLLLAKGADVELSSSRAGPPLVAAVATSQPDMVRKLLAKGASPEAQGDTTTTRNCCSCHWSTVTQALQSSYWRPAQPSAAASRCWRTTSPRRCTLQHTWAPPTWWSCY